MRLTVAELRTDFLFFLLSFFSTSQFKFFLCYVASLKRAIPNATSDAFRVLYGPFLLSVSSLCTDSEGILPGRDVSSISPFPLRPSPILRMFFLPATILRVRELNYLHAYLLASPITSKIDFPLKIVLLKFF